MLGVCIGMNLIRQHWWVSSAKASFLAIHDKLKKALMKKCSERKWRCEYCTVCMKHARKERWQNVGLLTSLYTSCGSRFTQCLLKDGKASQEKRWETTISIYIILHKFDSLMWEQKSVKICSIYIYRIFLRETTLNEKTDSFVFGTEDPMLLIHKDFTHEYWYCTGKMGNGKTVFS